MKLSWFGRLALALFASLALGLGMTACGGYTVAYLWVLGQNPSGPGGQIAAFKVDAFTGNLTDVPHEPFASTGSTPVSLVVKPGGRYVYVLNQGTYDPLTGVQTGDGIVEFSVGGDGTLNYEQTYHSPGFIPVWLQLDSTGTYLYVLNKISGANQPNPQLPNYTVSDPNGSISAWVIDATTGRLQLVQNTQSIPPNQPALNYWDVGVSPLMMKGTGSCLFTVNSGDQTITPYSFGGGGQLVTVTTGNIITHATDITSINGNGSNIILTDAGADHTQPGLIIPYQASGCTLSSLSGGNKQDLAGTSNPSNSLISTGGSNTYLYILHKSTNNTTTGNPYSTISGFQIVPSSGLQPLTGNTIFPVDAGPVCMVEDQTNRYMFTSNQDAGTVTGKIFDSTTGQLSDLSRGTSFAATQQASCLAISSAVD
jgi:6-phosphogluconolactonase (cycloisomerase 2 family)